MASEPDQICRICCWYLQLTDTKLTGNISYKLSSISSVFLLTKPEWQSCISWWNHVYIQYGHLNSTKICRFCSLCQRPVLSSAKFCENIQILRKWANSVAWLKILHSAENCGPYTAPSQWIINQAYRGSRHVYSGMGWCRLLSVLPWMDIHSSRAASTHGDFAGPASATLDSRWHEEGPCDETPEQQNCTYFIKTKIS